MRCESIDFGEIPFFLDTGATHSVIHRSLVEGAPLYTSKFKLGNVDFGTQKLLVTEWEQLADEGAILGMDFLKAHLIYIDFPNKVLYIK